MGSRPKLPRSETAPRTEPRNSGTVMARFRLRLRNRRHDGDAARNQEMGSGRLWILLFERSQAPLRDIRLSRPASP